MQGYMESKREQIRTYVNDIAFLELTLVGDPMTNHLIDRAMT